MRYLIFILVLGCADPVHEVVPDLIVKTHHVSKTRQAPPQPPESAVLTEAVEVEGPLPSAVQRAAGRLTSPLRARGRRRAEAWNIPDADDYDMTVLVLARICVSEAGWRSAEDCEGIYQVLRNIRRSDETLLGAMRRASRFASEAKPPRRSRQRWLASLNADGNEPDGWPDHLNWNDYRDRWFRVLQISKQLIDGDRRPSTCPSNVIAWGGAMDDWIALQRGLERVDCDGTANRFWIRPSDQS